GQASESAGAEGRAGKRRGRQTPAGRSLFYLGGDLLPFAAAGVRRCESDRSQHGAAPAVARPAATPRALWSLGSISAARALAVWPAPPCWRPEMPSPAPP